MLELPEYLLLRKKKRNGGIKYAIYLQGGPFFLNFIVKNYALLSFKIRLLKKNYREYNKAENRP